MRRWKLVSVISSVIVLALSSVWLRLQVVRTSYEINQQDKLIKNLLLEKETLEAELARLKSPERLEKLARSEFQMEQASVSRILPVKTSLKTSLALNEKN